MIDHQSARRSDLQRRNLPPSSSERGWDFPADASRPRVVPLALTYLVGALIFVVPLIAWCVL